MAPRVSHKPGTDSPGGDAADDTADAATDQASPAPDSANPAPESTNPVPGREAFPHRSILTTRWNDNDVYGHVNNVEYYAFFDTVINRWLIAEGGLDIHRGEVIGVCAESQCTFLAPIAFPDDLEAGLRVAHLGRTSVRYEIGLFSDQAGEGEPLAFGSFVHVFVDRHTRRPTPIPDRIRACLERLRPGEGQGEERR